MAIEGFEFCEGGLLLLSVLVSLLRQLFSHPFEASAGILEGVEFLRKDFLFPLQSLEFGVTAIDFRFLCQESIEFPGALLGVGEFELLAVGFSLSAICLLSVPVELLLPPLPLSLLGLQLREGGAIAFLCLLEFVEAGLGAGKFLGNFSFLLQLSRQSGEVLFEQFFLSGGLTSNFFRFFGEFVVAIEFEQIR